MTIRSRVKNWGIFNIDGELSDFGVKVIEELGPFTVRKNVCASYTVCIHHEYYQVQQRFTGVGTPAIRVSTIPSSGRGQDSPCMTVETSRRDRTNI